MGLHPRCQVNANRLAEELRNVDVGFSEVVRRIPEPSGPPLPANWLRYEMLERFHVLRLAGVPPGGTVLEVGSGAHAIATVPLAYRLGPGGCVVAGEPGRWTYFQSIVHASGLSSRVRPVACDARRLPFADDAFALAVCVHGVRSLTSDSIREDVFREMLRVAPRLFVAESLPLATSDAQKAHLEMYNLREGVFRAVTGRPDDLHYPTLEELTARVERAGGAHVKSSMIEVRLPHALAYFPREMAERIPDAEFRDETLRRWEHARDELLRVGEEHPPVGVVIAGRP